MRRMNELVPRVTAQDRFILRQRFAAGGQPLRVLAARRGRPSARSATICFAEQKRFKFKEDIRFYTDDTKTTEVMRLKARQRFDPAARYDVTDAQGNTIGEIHRRPSAPSLIRSTYVIYDADGEETARARRSATSSSPSYRRLVAARALRRRLRRLAADPLPLRPPARGRAARHQRAPEDEARRHLHAGLQRRPAASRSTAASCWRSPSGWTRCRPARPRRGNLLRDAVGPAAAGGDDLAAHPDDLAARVGGGDRAGRPRRRRRPRRARHDTRCRGRSSGRTRRSPRRRPRCRPAAGSRGRPARRPASRARFSAMRSPWARRAAGTAAAPRRAREGGDQVDVAVGVAVLDKTLPEPHDGLDAEAVAQALLDLLAGQARVAARDAAGTPRW